MNATRTPTATAAIINHVIEAIDRNSDKELRIALLIREAFNDLALHILRRFVHSLAEHLQQQHPDMERLQGELGSVRYCDFGWRHRTWPKGVSIRLEFDGTNFKWPSIGVCAPNAAALKDTDEETRAQYVRIGEELRQDIAEAFRAQNCIISNGESSDWYPIYTYLPAPLDDWVTAETLPIIAGTERFEGRSLVEWMSREFVEARNALRPVLG